MVVMENDIGDIVDMYFETFHIISVYSIAEIQQWITKFTVVIRLHVKTIIFLVTVEQILCLK
jgi:hypothetical protein